MGQPAIDFATQYLPKPVGDLLNQISNRHGANATVFGVSLGLLGLMLMLQNMFGKSGAAIPWKIKATNYRRVPTGRFISSNGNVPVPPGAGQTIPPALLAAPAGTGLLGLSRK